MFDISQRARTTIQMLIEEDSPTNTLLFRRVDFLSERQEEVIERDTLVVVVVVVVVVVRVHRDSYETVDSDRESIRQ